VQVLVTGGAGYVGSHVVLATLAAGHDVHVVEDFTRGSPAAIHRAEQLAGRQVTVHAADVADIDTTERIFAGTPFDAVVHLAGLHRSGTAPSRVLDLYETNQATTFTLLRCMAWYGVTRFVLSSTADVYGPARGDGTLGVDSVRVPRTPLGRSLLGNEHLLHDLVESGAGLRAAVLRRFATAGAHPSGRLGQAAARSTTSLLPRLTQVATGRREVLEVPGAGRATHDGTPVRDVVHVADVADAYVAALGALDGSPGVRTWNVGTGRGSSVLDVLRTFEEVTGRTVPHRVVEPADRVRDSVVADVDGTVADLGWTPRRGLADVCRDHWRWAQDNPDGYPETLVPEPPWRGGVGHRLRVLSSLAPS
jgi:UDP-glucose 4-epimerase